MCPDARAAQPARPVQVIESLGSAKILGPRGFADPAAESFAYPVSVDVRELVTLEDVMEEMELGPNGCDSGL